MKHVYHITFMVKNLCNFYLPHFLGLSSGCMHLWQQGSSPHCQELLLAKHSQSSQPLALTLLCLYCSIPEPFPIFSSLQNLSQPFIPNSDVSSCEMLFLTTLSPQREFSAFLWTLKKITYYPALLMFHFLKTLDRGVSGQALTQYPLCLGCGSRDHLLANQSQFPFL